jgi:ribosomal protein S18 acetylase RimI-like enzyme
MLTHAEWRDRAGRGGTHLARAGQEWVGTATGIPGEAAGEAELVGMWVASRWRGRGAGDLLVQSVIGWAAEHGYANIHLWVAVANHPAERLYARHGFTRTGATQPIREDDPTRLELEMRRALDRPQPDPGAAAPGPRRESATPAAFDAAELIRRDRRG